MSESRCQPRNRHAIERAGELLPCPHCGARAWFESLTQIRPIHTATKSVVRCENCAAESHAMWSIDELVARWNRRDADVSALRNAIAALRAELAEARGRCDEMETTIKELVAHIDLGTLSAICVKTMQRRREDATPPAEPDARGTTGE